MQLQNLFGALGLDDTLQKIATYLQQIASTIGRTYPDVNGRMQVNVVAGTLPGVTSVTTVVNLTQQSGFSTAYDQYAQMLSCASLIRSNIKVS